LSKDEIEYLEKIASVYHSEDLAGPNEQYHLRLRDTVIPQTGGRTALEIGCGKGLWSVVLARLYDTLDIVDGSRQLLERVVGACAGQKARIETHVGLAEEFLSATTKKWQHIYIAFLLEHVEDPVDLLRKAGRRLDSGGRLFVCVPNCLSIHRVVAFRAGMIRTPDELSANDRKVGHRRVYSEELLRRHLEEAGLQIVEMKGIGLKVASLAQIADWPPEVIAAFSDSGDLAPGHAAYIAATVISAKVSA